MGAKRPPLLLQKLLIKIYSKINLQFHQNLIDCFGLSIPQLIANLFNYLFLIMLINLSSSYCSSHTFLNSSLFLANVPSQYSSRLEMKTKRLVGPRCEVSSDRNDVVQSPSLLKSSTVSALESLKISSADSQFSFLNFHYFLLYLN